MDKIKLITSIFVFCLFVFSVIHITGLIEELEQEEDRYSSTYVEEIEDDDTFITKKTNYGGGYNADLNAFTPY